MRNIIAIRNIIVSLAGMTVLAWAFPRNNLFGKMLISPFLICSAAYFLENLFLLLGRERIADLFRSIFRMGFFIYAFGFLSFALYYSIARGEYSLLILIIPFFVVILLFARASFTGKK